MTWIRNYDQSTDIHSRLSREKNDDFILFGNSIPVANEKFLSLTTIHDCPERMINSVPFRFHPNRKRYILRSRHYECTSQGAPTYSFFSKPLKMHTRYISDQSNQSPSGPVYTKKHDKSFGFTRLIWIRRTVLSCPNQISVRLNARGRLVFFIRLLPQNGVNRAMYGMRLEPIRSAGLSRLSLRTEPNRYNIYEQNRVDPNRVEPNCGRWECKDANRTDPCTL